MGKYAKPGSDGWTYKDQKLFEKLSSQNPITKGIATLFAGIIFLPFIIIALVAILPFVIVLAPIWIPLMLLKIFHK